MKTASPISNTLILRIVPACNISIDYLTEFLAYDVLVLFDHNKQDDNSVRLFYADRPLFFSTPDTDGKMGIR